jgi:hypothetical protein
LVRVKVFNVVLPALRLRIYDPTPLQEDKGTTVVKQRIYRSDTTDRAADT